MLTYVFTAITRIILQLGNFKIQYICFSRFEWRTYDLDSGIDEVYWRLFDNFTGIDIDHGTAHLPTQGDAEVRVLPLLNVNLFLNKKA